MVITGRVLNLFKRRPRCFSSTLPRMVYCYDFGFSQEFQRRLNRAGVCLLQTQKVFVYVLAFLCEERKKIKVCKTYLSNVSLLMLIYRKKRIFLTESSSMGLSGYPAGLKYCHRLSELRVHSVWGLHTCNSEYWIIMASSFVYFPPTLGFLAFYQPF